MNYHPPDRSVSAQAVADPGASAEPQRSAGRRFAWIGTAASVLIFGLSVAVLWHFVSDVDAGELQAAFTAATLRQIGLALLLTAVSYLCLTCYDALALRQLKIKVPYRTTALASFTSYAVSFNLGFPLLTGGTVRYWIYAKEGLSAGKVASLTVVAGLTFWLGMGIVLGWSLIREAGPLAVLTWTNVKLIQAMGVASVVVVVGYLAWVSLKRRAVKIQGWRLELPGFRLSLGQALIGALDVSAAAAVLYLLIPGARAVGFETFLAIYVFAVMLGIASHSPGGLGVFEATMLLALSSLPREPVLGGLLLFRIIYYFAPFVLALALLGGYEALNRLRSTRGALTPADEPEP